jgi:hypothetical protein
VLQRYFIVVLRERERGRFHSHVWIHVLHDALCGSEAVGQEIGLPIHSCGGGVLHSEN